MRPIDRASAQTACLANPLFCFRAISSNRQRAGEFEKAAPQGRIVDPIIGADEFYRLAPPQGIGIKGFGGGLGKTRGNRRGSYRVHVIEEDGRVFVKRAGRSGTKYDLVLLDAFDHEYIPEHMLTREFLQEVKAVMQPDGVLAANTFSNSRLYAHESATYEAVFGRFYNLKDANRVILVKLDGLPSQGIVTSNASSVDNRLAVTGTTAEWLLPMFSSARDWPAGTRVLTDQYSPANLLNVQ